MNSLAQLKSKGVPSYTNVSTWSMVPVYPSTRSPLSIGYTFTCVCSVSLSPKPLVSVTLTVYSFAVA